MDRAEGALVTRRIARVVLPWLLALAAAATSRAALAHEPTPKDRATARDLAVKGYEALQAGDYELSADRFKRADALVHAPTLLVDLGRSYVGLGRLVDAHEAFQQVLREGAPAEAPASWHRAVEAAQREDAALAPRLAWVTIRVEGAENPHVKLDNEELPQVSLGVRRAVDPGHRIVVAEAEGFLSARSATDLGEGEEGEIDLVLKRDPNYQAPSPTKTSEHKPVTLVDRAPSLQRTPAYVAYGVGAAGLLLSGVSTALMLDARADLQRECHGGRCPLSAAGDLSKYHTHGTLAAVGLGVGLAGAAVGTYFLLSQKANDETEQPYTVIAQVSPGYVALRGRF